MKFLLGSKSPRRQALLRSMDIDFTVVNIGSDEIFEGVSAPQVAKYLACKKSNSFRELSDEEVLITSDTTVLMGEEIYNKPADTNQAIAMLKSLSGNVHQVITGVCIRTNKKQVSFDETTEVEFASLSLAEIDYYVSKFKPFDKAGAYGIQEWIGIIGVKGIRGCYYNVMGLPCNHLYTELIRLNLLPDQKALHNL